MGSRRRKGLIVQPSHGQGVCGGYGHDASVTHRHSLDDTSPSELTTTRLLGLARYSLHQLDLAPPVLYYYYYYMRIPSHTCLNVKPTHFLSLHVFSVTNISSSLAHNKPSTLP